MSKEGKKRGEQFQLLYVKIESLALKLHVDILWLKGMPALSSSRSKIPM